MQSYLAVVAFLLFGQVAGDGRYPGYPEAGGSAAVESAAGQETAPWEAPPVTPREQAPARDAAAVGGGAASNSVVPKAEPPQQAMKPIDLLESLSQPPVSGRLAGEAVTLIDAVATASSRSEQTAIVAAYWQLSTAITDYYLALRESTELETSLGGITQPGAAWQEAKRAQATRVQLARRTAELAQLELHKLMKSSAIDGLPLPVDKPHVGAYETRYEQNFAGRQTNRSREMHEAIPVIYDNLKHQMAQVRADQNWLDLVSRQRRPQSDGTLLLKTHELLGLRRRQFVQTVLEYNLQIARYSELASPGRVGTQRLVAMLIERPSASIPGRDSSGVSTASAEEPADSGNSLRNQNQTFAPESRDVLPRDVRREPTGGKNGEHSILVQPIR